MVAVVTQASPLVFSCGEKSWSLEFLNGHWQSSSRPNQSNSHPVAYVKRSFHDLEGQDGQVKV